MAILCRETCPSTGEFLKQIPQCSNVLIKNSRIDSAEQFVTAAVDASSLILEAMMITCSATAETARVVPKNHILSDTLGCIAVADRSTNDWRHQHYTRDCIIISATNKFKI